VNGREENQQPIALYEQLDSLNQHTIPSLSRNKDVHEKVDRLLIAKLIELKANITWKPRKNKPFKQLKSVSAKKILLPLISLALIFAVIISMLPVFYGVGDFDISVSIGPNNVVKDDLVFINATIPTQYNITKVWADMADVETINLTLIDNTTTDQFWQGTWLFRNLSTGDHIANISAVDQLNTSYYTLYRWTITSTVSENESVEDDTGGNASQNITDWNDTGWDNESIVDNTTTPLDQNDTVSFENNSNPIILEVYPANESTGLDITPVLNVTVSDPDGDRLNITWYSNSSGTWQIFGINASCSNDTYHQTNSNFSNYGITYYWNVSVNDGTTTNNSPIYHFTTETESTNNPAYHYWYSPENSFGIQNMTFVNWSYFWSLFRQHSVWQMEGWNPVTEEWVDNYQGTNLNEWLNISKIRADDNASEKITLNFTSPYTTKYRFTFGIDAQVKEYVNRSGQYEYTLTYPANATEDYVVYFNWSDVIPMVENGAISLKHGIKNINGIDVFWFRIVGNQQLQEGKSFEIDPTFGHMDAESNFWTISNQICALLPIAPPAFNGIADSISVFMTVDWGVGEEAQCALYNSDSEFIASTEERSGGEFLWQTFDFIDPKPNITKNTNYYICVYSDDTIGIKYGNEPGYTRKYETATYPEWESPIDWDGTNANQAISIYCTYMTHNPIQSNQKIWNATTKVEKSLNATNVDLYPTSFNVTISDADGDNMNITIMTNESGTWTTVNQTSGSGLSNGAYNFTNCSWVDSYSTKYWISFNLTDGYDWTNETYHFTTEAINTSVDTISPYEVTASSLTVTANAEHDDYSNVTLWYRYSSDNASWGSNWWNASWTYRKSCTVTNNIDDYQMKIIVGNSSGGNVTCGGHAQSDFDDIRFVNSTGNELPYWRENYTADTQATFWINNSYNDSKIWMYYGNNSVSTTSNGTNTFIFFDDFEGSNYNTDVWETQGTDTTWTVANSIMTMQSTGDPGANGAEFRLKQSANITVDGAFLCAKMSAKRDINSWATQPSLTLKTTEDPDTMGMWYRAAGGDHMRTGYNLNGVNYGENDDISSEAWTDDAWHYFIMRKDPSTPYVSFQVLKADKTQWGNEVTNNVAFTDDMSPLYFIYYQRVYSSGYNTKIDYVFISKWTVTEPSWSSFGSEEEAGWMQWDNASQNPDTNSPWSWEFDFPNGIGYYEFYSIGKKSGSTDETPPSSADAHCHYITVPTVTTNEPTGVEETNATLRGYLSNDGGLTATCGFRYGTSSGVYSENFSKDTYSSGTEFSNDNGSLTSGDLYYYQAWASNPVGFANGSEMIFFTKPPAVTSLAESSSTNTTLTYTWIEATVGSGATAYTRIQYKTGSKPTSITDGTNTYNGTDETDDTISLTPGTRYYFSAFSWGTEGGIGNWNDTYDTMDAWTNPGDPTSVSAINGSTWVNVTFTHGTNGEYTMVRRNASGSADYPADRSSGTQVDNTTNAYANDIGLTTSTTYYYSLWTWDPDGGKWCDYQTNITGTAQANNPPNKPTLNAPSPSGTYVNTQDVVLNVTVTDPDGDNMNVSFYELLNNITFKQNLTNAGDYVWPIYADDDYVYAGGSDNKVQVYYRSNFSLKTELTNAGHTIYSVYADDDYVYAGGSDDEVHVYYRNSLSLKTKLTDPGNTVYSVYADDDYVYAGGYDNKVQVYYRNNLSLKTELTDPGDCVWSVYADDDYVYAGGEDNKVQVYYRSNLSLKTELTNAGYTVYSVYADDDHVYAGGSDDKVQVYYRNNLSLKTELTDAGSNVYSVYADDDYVYAGGSDDKVQVYYRNNLSLKTELTDAGDRIWSVYADDDYVYAGGWDDKVQVYYRSNLLNTSTGVNNGSDVTYTWSDLSDSITYEWYAKATDIYGLANKSDTWNFTILIDTSINVTPSQWNIGTIDIGNTTNTTGFYFNLTNEGNVALDITINATNATNSTSGAEWRLNTTQGHDNFSLQYNLSGASSWTNINITFDTFVTSLAIGGYQTFDLKLLMATTSSTVDPMGVTVTFKSVAI